jgi:large subunit ribosomal protein L23
MNIRDVIIAPVITEKSMKDAATGRYTFKVEMATNRPLIKQAIQDKFKVKVTKIMISLVKGKTDKRGAKREEYVKTAWKKATVQLAKDQKIGLFDVGGQTEQK